MNAVRGCAATPKSAGPGRQATHICRRREPLRETRPRRIAIRIRRDAIDARSAVRSDRDRSISIGAVAFAPDGRIAVAPQIIRPFVPGRFVLILDPRTNEKAVYRSPWASLPTAAWTNRAPSSSVPMATGFSSDCAAARVIRWQLPDEGSRFELPGPPTTNAVEAIVISPDSKWLYTGGADGAVKQWGVDGDGKPER